ncbi:tetratricopeptide repeat protein [Tissierella sp. MSJ-40]|uniref:Tetratricopeptide repeat protein n=1 Tax=Tissierella simiarum TaxID=2841534 RepID=A0ABS6EB73_9FIRM|nr:tetratricopeptide repeat protein [Tissierella simiarum]MBU5440165.1 tetratricopeptide repeat protein [Tissierella simiarum]
MSIMVKCNNLSIGENLKRIRTELGLKQYEITGGEITRNLISIIENNKTPLTEDNAKLICRNINKIMEDKGLDIIIEPEDIFNPDRYDAKKQSDLYIKELDNLISTKDYNIETEYINEIETFLNKWNLVDKKIRIYEILGDIYYNLRNYSKGYHYYSKGWEHTFNYPNKQFRYKLVLKLVVMCIFTNRYKEATNLCDYALLNKKDIPRKHMGILHYNNALAYKELNLIDKCLEQTSEYFKYIESTNYKELVRTFILQGLCYLEIKKYDEALKSYNKALDILHIQENLEDLCLVYVNSAEIYLKMNCKDKAIEYINKVLDNISKLNINSNYPSKLYNQIAIIYNYLNEFDLAEKYYNESLVYARKNNQNEIIKENLLQIFDLYQKSLDYKKIFELIKNHKDILLDIPLDKNILLILKTLEFHIINKGENEALQLIENLITNNEEEKEDEN